MRRPLLIAIALAGAAAALALLFLVRSLDGRVELYLETMGSELLGSEVRVGSVDVDLRAGRATVRGLEVANPRGEGLAFSDTPALRFGEIAVTIDPASLAGETVVLETVSVDAPLANLEVTPGGVNLVVLSRNLDHARPKTTDAPSGGETPQRFSLRELRIAQGTLRADASAVGRGVQEQPLPALALGGFGGAQGLAPGELGRQLFRTYLLSVLAQATTDRVGELLAEQLDKVKARIAEGLMAIFGASKKKE